MTILSNFHVIAYANGISHIIGEIFVDDVSELPAPDGIDGYKLVQSSVAYAIKSGEFFIMSSDGIWHTTNGEAVSNGFA